MFCNKHGDHDDQDNMNRVFFRTLGWNDANVYADEDGANSSGRRGGWLRSLFDR